MDATAAALADPVRRRILLMLRGGALSAGEIAGAFAISRPAVSRHLRVLRESGLVAGEARGRQRVYTLEAAPLEELRDWLAGFDRQWDARLDALETEVHRTRRDRRAAAPTTPTKKELSA